MKKILECVPNFSEGKSTSTIEKISKAIQNTNHVKLLDVDPGIHANRTVFTFAGEPHSIIDAAFNAIEVASKLIDMRHHSGEHPRIGAVDVCPLIPISGIDMPEAVELSNTLAKRVANELGIPTFLYENSAKSKERKNLAWLRSGEYENLEKKLTRSDFTPDYGSNIFNPKAGIAIIGARNYLIAYNINLDTKDVSLAKSIAEEIRESGKNGVPGKLENVKAIGWYIKEFDKVQISLNLTDFTVTSIWQVYEEINICAQNRGINITGSELVGMIPLKAITDCGEFFLKKNNIKHHISQSELVDYAVNYLGLNEVKEFNKNKKIIEFALNA